MCIKLIFPPMISNIYFFFTLSYILPAEMLFYTIYQMSYESIRISVLITKNNIYNLSYYLKDILNIRYLSQVRTLSSIGAII